VDNTSSPSSVKPQRESKRPCEEEREHERSGEIGGRSKWLRTGSATAASANSAAKDDAASSAVEPDGYGAVGGSGGRVGGRQSERNNEDQQCREDHQACANHECELCDALSEALGFSGKAVAEVEVNVERDSFEEPYHECEASQCEWCDALSDALGLGGRADGKESGGRGKASLWLSANPATEPEGRHIRHVTDASAKMRGLKRKIVEADTLEDSLDLLLEASRMEARRRKRTLHATADPTAAVDEVPQGPSDHDVAASSETEVDEAVQPDDATPAAEVLTAQSDEGAAAAALTAEASVEDDMIDLLELAEADFHVVWPQGWSFGRAQNVRRERKRAG